MTKHLNTQSLLWLALVLALLASLKHLTAVFASVDGADIRAIAEALLMVAPNEDFALGVMALAHGLGVKLELHSDSTIVGNFKRCRTSVDLTKGPK